MRRIHQLLSIAAFSAAFAVPAFAAECPVAGPAPAIPDGATATADQFKAARAAVQTYVNSLGSIQDCNEAKIKMMPKDTKPDVLQKLRDAGNAAVDQSKALAVAYSTQKKICETRAASPCPAPAPK